MLKLGVIPQLLHSNGAQCPCPRSGTLFMTLGQELMFSHKLQHAQMKKSLFQECSLIGVAGH
jgi:hypothetical protein